MSIPKSVHAAVEESRSSTDCAISEDRGRLHVTGRLSRAALTLWQSIFDQQSGWLKLSCIDESEDIIPPGDARDGERVRLTLTFKPIENAAHFFTIEGWRSFLLCDGLVTRVTIVRLAFTECSFSTKSFALEPWDAVPVEMADANRQTEGGPRRQVRCHAANFMAPSQIQPWIVMAKPTSEDGAWNEWGRVAKEMIARSLPNELYVEADERQVALAGQPSRRLSFGKIEDNCPFEPLQEAAKWLYLEGTDTEVRHTFLTSELAREWPSQSAFCEKVGERVSLALDSARLLYRAHLRSGSKDTLKALGDLRKGLADEVQKLVQQARDLSSALWRDVALAIGVLAVRLAMDSTKAATVSEAFSIILFVVAFYIAISFWFTVSTNKRYFKEFEKTRSAWRPKLYSFLDDGDYKELADNPISGAIEIYQATEQKVRIVVYIVVAILLFVAGREAGFITIENIVILLKFIYGG